MKSIRDLRKYEVGISVTVMGKNSPFLFCALDAEEKTAIANILNLLLSIVYFRTGFLSGLEQIGTFLAERNHGIEK